MSNAELAQARTHDAKPAATLEQIRYVLGNMPHSSGIERRNRAVIAFLALTDIRVGPDDPLFPKSQIVVGVRTAFKTQRLSRLPWKATQPMGNLVRENFVKLGLLKYGPHGSERPWRG